MSGDAQLICHPTSPTKVQHKRQYSTIKLSYASSTNDIFTILVYPKSLKACVNNFDIITQQLS